MTGLSPRAIVVALGTTPLSAGSGRCALPAHLFDHGRFSRLQQHNLKTNRRSLGLPLTSRASTVLTPQTRVTKEKREGEGEGEGEWQLAARTRGTYNYQNKWRRRRGVASICCPRLEVMPSRAPESSVPVPSKWRGTVFYFPRWPRPIQGGRGVLAHDPAGVRRAPHA